MLISNSIINKVGIYLNCAFPVLDQILLEPLTFPVYEILVVFIIEILIIAILWLFLGIHLYFKDKKKQEEPDKDKRPLPWLFYRYKKAENFSISLAAKHLKVEKWWVYKYMPKVWKDDPVVGIITLVLVICFFVKWFS